MKGDLNTILKPSFLFRIEIQILFTLFFLMKSLIFDNDLCHKKAVNKIKIVVKMCGKVSVQTKKRFQ